MSKNAGVFLFLILATGLCCADVPQKMNYQGYLTSSNSVPVNGSRNITFRLYDAAVSGSNLWTETQSSVAVVNGIFDVVLGSVTSLSSLPAYRWREPLYLGVTIQGDSELTPRQEIVSTPYALSAQRVLCGNVVTVAQSGGDATNVSQALRIIAGMSPIPSSSNPYVIEVKAGVFSESASISLPNYVSLKGSGKTATTVSSANAVSIGSHVTVADLTFLLTTTAGKISVANTTNSHVRGCCIDLDQASPYAINFQGSFDCSFVDNTLKHGSSGLYTLYIQTAVRLLLQGNVVDISEIGGGTAIYACNITSSVVRDNTIIFEGATDASYGMQINNNTNTSRVTGNIFMGEIATPQWRDIYNVTTAAYPTRPTHTGPYGVNNQGSSGSELPAF